MTPTRTRVFVSLLSILLLLIAFVVAHVNPHRNARFDPATVVLVVTVTSVGIERFLEIIWTAVGLTKGAAWPMNLVKTKLDDVTNQLTTSLQPYCDHAQAIMAQLSVQQKWTTDQIKAAQGELDKITNLTKDMQETAQDKEQLQVFASAAAQYVNFIQAKYTTFLSAATDMGRSHDEAMEETATEAKSAAEEAAEKEGKHDEAALAGKLAYTTTKVEALLEDATQSAFAIATFKARLAGKPEEEITEAGEEAREEIKAQVNKVKETAKQQATARGATGYVAEHTGAQAALTALNQMSSTDPVRNVGLAVNLATQGIKGVTDFVATFKDNPGRRLISLYLASLIGLCIAGLLRLDVFQAILASPNTDANTPTAFLTLQQVSQQGLVETLWRYVTAPLHLGVALTGLLMGLGSSPTHEVIRVLQEYKKSRKQQNTPDTTTVDAPVADVKGASFNAVNEAGVFRLVNNLPDRERRPRSQEATVRFIRFR